MNLKLMLCSLTAFVAVIVFTAEAKVLDMQQTIALGTPSIPDHILTWAYDGGYGGRTDSSSTYTTNSVSKAHIQTWVNYAQGAGPNGRLQKNGADCPPGSSCIPIVYFEATRMRVNPSGACGDNAPEDWEWYQQASETQFKHYADPAPGVSPMSPANRITSRTNLRCNGGYEIMFFPNLSDPGYQAFWRKQLQSYNANSDYTEFMADTFSSALVNDAFAGTGNPGGSLKGSYEVRDQATAEIHHKSFAAAMYWPNRIPMKIFGNGAIGQLDPRGLPHLALLDQANIVGGVCEGCIATATRVNPGNVGSVLNLAANLQAYHPSDHLVLNGRSLEPAGSTAPCAANGASCGQIPARLFQLGVLWLASPGIVDFSNFANRAPTVLAVYPEQSIYPTNALREMGAHRAQGKDGTGCSSGSFDSRQIGGAKDLVVMCGQLANGKDAGVYVREFRKCYNFGQLIGAGQCAVILNASSSSVTPSSSWKYSDGSPTFRQSYTNSLSVNGGDVLSSGCGNSRCPSSALNPLGTSFALGTTPVPPSSALFIFHD